MMQPTVASRDISNVYAVNFGGAGGLEPPTGGL
jgi:hypothetical protein